MRLKDKTAIVIGAGSGCLAEGARALSVDHPDGARFSTPEDLANAALYPCSDEASLLTGVCMEIDGGRCI